MAERDSYLDQVPGFIAFHLLRGPEHEDYTLYSSHTMWLSQQAFVAWTQSEPFRAAHRDAGSQSRFTSAIRIRGIRSRTDP